MGYMGHCIVYMGHCIVYMGQCSAWNIWDIVECVYGAEECVYIWDSGTGSMGHCSVCIWVNVVHGIYGTK